MFTRLRTRLEHMGQGRPEGDVTSGDGAVASVDITTVGSKHGALRSRSVLVWLMALTQLSSFTHSDSPVVKSSY